MLKSLGVSGQSVCHCRYIFFHLQDCQLWEIGCKELLVDGTGTIRAQRPAVLKSIHLYIYCCQQHVLTINGFKWQQWAMVSVSASKIETALSFPVSVWTYSSTTVRARLWFQWSSRRRISSSQRTVLSWQSSRRILMGLCFGWSGSEWFLTRATR